VPRFQRFAYAVGKHETSVIPVAPEQQAALSLARAMLLQRRNDLVD